MNKDRSGFTMVEILAVVAIIGILAALVLGISGYVARKGDISKAQAALEKHAMAIDQYAEKYGQVWDGAIDASYSNAMASFVSDLRLSDPWNRAFRYQKLGTLHYRVWSLGPDGADGSADDIRAGSSD